MTTMQAASRLWKVLVLLGGATTLLATTCTSNEIAATVAGLDAAAHRLDHQDEDISFGDWLRDELDNL